MSIDKAFQEAWLEVISHIRKCILDALVENLKVKKEKRRERFLRKYRRRGEKMERKV